MAATKTPERGRTPRTGDLTPIVRGAIAVATDASALLLALHGIAHVTGFLTLWELAEPANLSYAETSPDPGSLAGRLAGLGWLAAGALFVAGAVLLVRRRRSWWIAVLAAAGLSLALLLPSQDGVAVGITADLLAILFVLKVLARPGPSPVVPARR